MDVETYRMMLERRGYSVQIQKRGTRIEYVIAGVLEGSRPASQFSRLEYKGARREIDRELGHGMQHCLHSCGHPLLRASAGYTCDDPFYRVDDPLKKTEYYAVPLRMDSLPLAVCPQCGVSLNAKTVHRVKDPEETI